MNVASRSVLTTALALVLAAAVSATDGSAQQRKKNPTLIYVPSPQNVVDKMLEVAKVTDRDFVIDLGSGDGRIPITAAKRYGARGLGVEIDRKLIAEARANAKAAGVADRVEFRRQDLFKTSVREATVVALYLFIWANVQLRPRLVSELKPGSRIVAHDFDLGDEWKPDIEEPVDTRSVYLWFVPAQVAGGWDVTGASQPFTLALRQEFQRIAGTATVAGRAVPLHNASLRGDEIEFTVELAEGQPSVFRGRVDGNAIEPRAEAAGAPAGWRAVRTSAAPDPVLKRRY